MFLILSDSTVLQAIAGEFNVPKNEIPTLTDVLTTIGTIAYCPWIKSANTQMVRISFLSSPCMTPFDAQR